MNKNTFDIIKKIKGQKRRIWRLRKQKKTIFDNLYPSELTTKKHKKVIRIHKELPFLQNYPYTVQKTCQLDKQKN